MKQATDNLPKPSTTTAESDQEKNLLGMIENLAKQLENFDENGDDADIDDATLGEAEKMMKGLFGQMMGTGGDEA